MSTPQAIARAVADDYRADATRWTQNFFAKDKDGNSLWNPSSERAVCWCLRGAIEKHCSNYGEVWSVACFHAFDRVLGFDHTQHPNDNEYHFVRWNDDPKRTVQEVIALCDEVAAS